MAVIIDGKELAKKIRANLKIECEELNQKGINSKLAVIMVGDDPASKVYVRNKRNGDKMTIKGMTGTKKISDIFIDDKIKTSERNAWPVVLDSEENIVWLPGLKKSKFDKKISQEYDIILKYVKKEK